MAAFASDTGAPVAFRQVLIAWIRSPARAWATASLAYSG